MTGNAYYTNSRSKMFPHNSGHRSSWLLLRFVMAMLTTLIFCGCTEEKRAEPKPPRAELKPAVDGLNSYYQSSPPGRNWKISTISTQGDQLLITVAIPPDQASQIMRQPADSQFRLVAEQICPGKDNPIWGKIPPDITVSVLPSVSERVFIEVSCNRQ